MVTRGEHAMTEETHLMDDALPEGTAVTVLSQLSGAAFAATVLSWRTGDQGLVVTARLSVDPEVALNLADHRVWVSAPDDNHGVTVFGGIAHSVSSTELDITGVAPVIRERRRRMPRAHAEAQVTLTAQEQTHHGLRAVDLSRDAVRVELAHPHRLSVGEHVEVAVDLGRGEMVPAAGEVTRVDHQDGYAVVRFEGLESEHGDRLDRYVLLRLDETA